jgi:hypothetical protein
VTDGFRHYVNFREVPTDQWCYSMNCTESSGGCGAEMSGDTAAEAVSKWNRRPNAKLTGPRENLRSDDEHH